jgi:hypothetical protein
VCFHLSKSGTHLLTRELVQVLLSRHHRVTPLFQFLTFDSHVRITPLSLFPWIRARIPSFQILFVLCCSPSNNRGTLLRCRDTGYPRVFGISLVVKGNMFVPDSILFVVKGQCYHQVKLNDNHSIGVFVPPETLPCGLLLTPQIHKCDLCKALWISQGRFTTESALPVQTLDHIQHTCEALSEIHTMTHHRCWRLIHGARSRLTFSTLRFICIHNEKSFRTVWTELAQEFPEVFNHCAEQTIWNAARDSEMQRPLTRAETIHRQQGISHE